jgi:uncharacterized protein (TIGR02231 family)
MLGLTAFPALAQNTLSPASQISAVTVFPDRAEVSRDVGAKLLGGANLLQIKDLPANLLVESLRITGKADAEIQIGALEARQVFSEEEVQEEEKRLRDEISALTDRQHALNDVIAAARLQITFLTSLSTALPEVIKTELLQGQLDPTRLQEILSLLGDGAGKAYESIQTSEIEKRALDEKITALKQRLSQIHTGRKASMTVEVRIEAAATASADLVLSYQVPGATWRPTYELRLDSEQQTSELVQMAEVRQRTGEDWANVALTLSTARPSLNAQLPELETWFIDIIEPRPLAKMKTESRSLESFATTAQAPAEPEMAEELMMDGGAGGEVSMKEAGLVTAEVRAGEFAADYLIPGRIDVRADQAAHKFAISQRSMDTKVAVQVAPRLFPGAYLYGEVIYDGDTPLLPGPVALFRDGAFVGRSQLDLLRPGEQVKLSFGQDNRVEVDYRLEQGERSEQGIINKDQRIERRYIAVITNHHMREIEITLLDQIPVPRDERIEVEAIKGTTPPSERDVRKRKGVLAWRNLYAPGEERTIRFGYSVTYPKDTIIHGL